METQRRKEEWRNQINLRRKEVDTMNANRRFVSKKSKKIYDSREKREKSIAASDSSALNDNSAADT